MKFRLKALSAASILLSAMTINATTTAADDTNIDVAPEARQICATIDYGEQTENPPRAVFKLEFSSGKMRGMPKRRTLCVPVALGETAVVYERVQKTWKPICTLTSGRHKIVLTHHECVSE